MPDSPFDDYLDLVEAARVLGIHPQSLRRLIKQKRVPATLFAGKYLIERDKRIAHSVIEVSERSPSNRIAVTPQFIDSLRTSSGHTVTARIGQSGRYFDIERAAMPDSVSVISAAASRWSANVIAACVTASVTALVGSFKMCWR